METLTPAAAERFLLYEARLLDEGRFAEWLALFTPDCHYWVPSQPGQASPKDTVSLIYDDRRLLETRVRRLGSPHMHAQIPPSRTSRMVTNVTLEESEDAGLQRVRSKLLVVEFRSNRQRVYAGTCWHGLVDGRRGRADEGPSGAGGERGLASEVPRAAGDVRSLKIAWKRVDLVDCDGELDGLSILL